jgi:CRP/FNR family transcriptional regulator
MNTSQAVDAFLASLFEKADPKLKESLVCVCRTQTAAKKETLFHEQQEGSTVYFLIEGSVKLFRVSEEGRESTIHLVGPGEIFAEILFELSHRYPVSAMALEPSTLLLIDADRFRSLITERPEFALRMIALLAKRLKSLVSTVEKMKQSSLRQRFVGYLKSLADEGETTVTLPAPKRELAMHLGVAPESLYRLVKKLTDDGTIAVDGRRVTLLKEEDVWE